MLLCIVRNVYRLDRNLYPVYSTLGLLIILAFIAGAECISAPACGPQFPHANDGPDDFELIAIAPQQTNMQPGGTRAFTIVRWECCYPSSRAVATPCVQWSVEPPSDGTIDNNGVFHLSSDAQPGQQIIIRAVFPDLEMTASVNVYTPEPNPLVGGVHDRMPVIVYPNQYDAWLGAETTVDQARAVLRPYDADLMKTYEVNRAVNSVKNDDERCIDPVGQ